MALDDPQLHNFLKVQLHITGADQVVDTYQATPHYQMPTGSKIMLLI
ncbi:hypothetical protein NC651_034341 [Populus alba x Populus x berolinensis]|nr:hypothetical protein NC651_034341 [Populus alba x Populus x berolinensis]